MDTLKQLVDETTNIKNDIKTCHINLIQKLTNKGVVASNSEKLNDLISKIDNITVGSLGGKKWATGSATTQKDSGDNSSYLEVKNLGFTPSVVLVNGANWWSAVHPYSILETNKLSGVTKLNTTTGMSSNIGTFYVSNTTNVPTHYGKSYVFKNAFRIVHTNSSNPNQVSWIAYE